MEDRRQLHHVERRTALLFQLAVQSGNLFLETGNLLLKLFALPLRATQVFTTVLDERLPYEECDKACQEQGKAYPESLTVENEPEGYQDDYHGKGDNAYSLKTDFLHIRYFTLYKYK